ncbi:MAG: autotransporter-associated beta strand repeat-containing protein [Planctomycetaceae bacterium]
MSLKKLLRTWSGLLDRKHDRRGRIRSLQSFLRGSHAWARSVSPLTDALEDRVLPATLAWVGDASTLWSANIDGNTNWSGDAVPSSGDALLFDVSATATLTHDLAAELSVSLTFASGSYTVTGQSIALHNPGPDILQISGENLLQTPLLLDASEIEVQSGVLTIDSTVSGTGGLTKSGSGLLVFSGAGNWSGATEFAAGTLQLDTAISSTASVSVASGAVLSGQGGAAGTLRIFGELAPGGDADGFTADSVEFSDGSLLRIRLGGTQPGQFDRLTLNGSARLAGAIAIELSDAFDPAPGDTFHILSASSVSSHFADWTGLEYPSGRLLPVQTPAGLVLIATPHAPPDLQLSVPDATVVRRRTQFTCPIRALRSWKNLVVPFAVKRVAFNQHISKLRVCDF